MTKKFISYSLLFSYVGVFLLFSPAEAFCNLDTDLQLWILAKKLEKDAKRREQEEQRG